MKLKDRIMIINFKNYNEISGEKGVKFAKIAEKIAKDLHIEIIISPPISDLALISKSVNIPVFSQHIDLIKPGSTTGYIVPEILKASGAIGTLINHSERKIPIGIIKELVPKMKSLDLLSVVCAGTPQETEERAKFEPDFLAIEPPDLIGSGIAVSKAKPEVITNSIDAIKAAKSTSKLICGAGITSGQDVKAALDLGSLGILVASAIVKADLWEEKIRELAKPLAF
jgi:triosephosphate isomerase